MVTRSASRVAGCSVQHTERHILVPQTDREVILPSVFATAIVAVLWSRYARTVVAQ